MKYDRTSYVAEVIADYIIIKCDSPEARVCVKARGARRLILNWKTWRVRYTTKQQLRDHFVFFRDNGIAFAGGPAGWPPAAIFDDFRRSGEITGGYLEVCWSESEKYTITLR